MLGIAAVVAGIVLLVKNWDWLRSHAVDAWNAVVSWGKKAIDWIAKVPGWVGGFFANIGRSISSPFLSAFNHVADAWNNTVGRLSWTVPSWIPVVGGNTVSVPHIPHFHEGGTVPGVPGSNVLALLQGGETVSPVAGGGAGSVIEIRSGGSDLDDLLVEVLSRAVRRRGGDVQLVLGGRKANAA